MTTQLITAHFIRFTRHSTSIGFSSLILTCSLPLFPSPLFFPFFISSKFLTGSSSNKLKMYTLGNLLRADTVPAVVYVVDWVPLILKEVVNIRWKLVTVKKKKKNKKTPTCLYMIDDWYLSCCEFFFLPASFPQLKYFIRVQILGGQLHIVTYNYKYITKDESDNKINKVL